MSLPGRGCAGPSVSTVPGAECPTELKAAPLPAVTVVSFFTRGPRSEVSAAALWTSQSRPPPLPKVTGVLQGPFQTWGSLGRRGGSDHTSRGGGALSPLPTQAPPSLWGALAEPPARPWAPPRARAGLESCEVRLLLTRHRPTW